MKKKLLNKPLRNKRNFWALGAVLLIALVLLAACQPAATATQAPAAAQPTATVAATTAPMATSTTSSASGGATAVVPATGANQPTTEAMVNVANDPKLGKILVDGKGMTLYIFTKDGPDKSNCAGKCMQAWPPLLSLGSPKAGDGVDASMLGTTALADGSKIVTYNHMPLYYWQGDKKPGDTSGQDVNKVWFVVSPDGKPVGMEGSSSTSSGSSASAPASGDVVINVATDPKLGKILVDAKGMTLYMFKKDAADKSNCSGGCLAAWPPLVSQGSVKAGDGVDQSLIGSTDLADGRKVVTYNHMPLYYFAKDMKPGDVNGQDVNQVWYVVSPDGKAVEDASSSSSSSSSGSSGSAAASSVQVNVATDAKLGKILVDSKGMTLYMFTKDAPDKSNCTGGCLTAWPPLLTTGAPTAGDGVNASLLGTATLADGSKIVTYNKMPLYYWKGDAKAGDTSGQGVNNVWYVVSPDGQPVKQSSTGY